jgi:hypothetical protein
MPVLLNGETGRRVKRVGETPFAAQGKPALRNGSFVARSVCVIQP